MPFFNTLANGTTMPSQANFMNHLAATMNNTPTTHSTVPLHNSPTNATSSFNPTKSSLKNSSRRNPEPPPPPRLRSPSPTCNNVKPNQGTAPMDLENDLENDMSATLTASTTTVQSEVTPKMTLAKIQMSNMPDSSLYMNGLMASQMCANPGFMFFPTNPAAGAATSNTIMDPAAMMAAMQQMQQYGAYGNGSLTDTTVDPGKLGQTTGIFVNKIFCKY